MSTASKGVDARHNLHLAVDIFALRASRGECQMQCVKDLERGFPTCERNDVALAARKTLASKPPRTPCGVYVKVGRRRRGRARVSVTTTDAVDASLPMQEGNAG